MAELEAIADALDKGAELLTGGGRHELGGTFFQPTVLSGMTPEMQMISSVPLKPLSESYFPVETICLRTRAC